MFGDQTFGLSLRASHLAAEADAIETMIMTAIASAISQGRSGIWLPTVRPPWFTPRRHKPTKLDGLPFELHLAHVLIQVLVTMVEEWPSRVDITLVSLP